MDTIIFGNNSFTLRRNKKTLCLNYVVGFLVAAGGGEGYIWNFKGGNSHICTKLFEISNATVRYNTKVSRIEKSLKNGGKYVYHLYGDNIKNDVGSDYGAVSYTHLTLPTIYSV